jgi:UTP--glucose-1-phosphate uridylyltransferase
MLTVFDRPAIQYVVDEAREAGIEHIVFVTGRNKAAIEDYFDRAYELEDTLERKKKFDVLEALRDDVMLPGAMSFVRQQMPNGLGHAVWCARDIIGDEPFAVLLPDVLIQNQPGCLKQMIDAYGRVGGNLIAVDPIPRAQTGSFGVIDPMGDSVGGLTRMRGMVEKPHPDVAPSTLRITGRYLLQPEIFGWLERQAPGAGGEIQLTDAMAALMQEQPFHAAEFDGLCYDCGDKIGYLAACVGFGLAHADMGAQARASLTEELAKPRS